MNVLKMFLDCEALLEGHFLLSSGLHSNRYLQCAKVLQYPEKATALGNALAEKVKALKIETVVGPAMGGIIIAHEVGRALNAKVLFAERVQGEIQLRRGFEVKPNERILVVEDVVTTGGSAKETGELMTKLGANVVGYASIIDRSGGQKIFDKPYMALETLTVETFEKENCPLCAAGTQAIKPGSKNN